MNITCGIATKNRHDLLAATLLSVALQTLSPAEIIIVDDSDESIDLRNLPGFQHVFTLLNFKNIPFKVLYGRKLGQHYSHQLIQEEAKADWIWRLDDDEVAEPDVLAKLWHWTTYDKKVGAVGGLVPQGPLGPAPVDAANIISDLTRPNVQWFGQVSWPHPIEVEHLHSSFLYRKGIARYELGLSPAAHREETILTHEIFRAGYKLLVDPTAATWHVRSQGGIRSHQDPQFWENDEKVFQARLQEWGVNSTPTKIIMADCGLGDSVVIKSLLPELKEKYGKIVIAACHPTIFEDDGCELISVAEGKQRLGDRFAEEQNIYRRMIDWRWHGSLEDAYRKLWL